MLAGISSCGEKQEKTAANSDAPLTYWCKLETVHSTSVSTLNDLELYKQLQEKTGVEIEFIHPPAGQEQEQFNLMMSSRDFPDIIETDWTKLSGGASKAISDKIIVPINDLLDSSAPNYKKILEENSNLMRAFSTDSGDVFAFGDVVLEPKITSGGLMIRRDWLKKLGMDMPETIEDWETYFDRIKNELGVATPFTTDKYRMENAMLFSSSFGIGPGFYVAEDGSVKYGPSEPAYKEYLTLMSDWFAKGYLDNGTFSNTSSIAESKILNGESGAFYGFIGSTLGRIIPSAKDEEFDMIGINNPTIDGYGQYTSVVADAETSTYGYSTTANAGVTVVNKNPEKTAKFFDYLYSEEGKMLKIFGIEGVTYNMVDGIPTYTEAITKDPDGLPLADAMGKYFRATYPSPGFINDINYYNQYYTYPQQKETLEIYKTGVDSATAFALPPIALTEEESDEISNIITTIDTFKSEMFTKFIMGTEPIENFDKYIETLNGMGLARVLEVYNNALVKYYNR